jgi:CRP-like cAMP-binding protein
VTAPSPDVLRRVPLLAELDDAGLGEWVGVAEERWVADGAVVAEQGRPAEGLVLLIEGAVQAVLVTADGMWAADRIEAPAWFGAVSVLGETELSMRVVARSELRYVVVPASACRRLVGRHPDVLRRLMAGLGEAGRLAAQMGDALQLLGTTAGRVLESDLPRDALRDLADLQQEALARAGTAGGAGAPLQALCERLALLDVAEPSWLAETLATAGLTPAWIDRVVAVAGPAGDIALRWIAAGVAAQCRAAELRRASARWDANL